jgi:hypothetical protein
MFDALAATNFSFTPGFSQVLLATKKTEPFLTAFVGAVTDRKLLKQLRPFYPRVAPG